MQDEGGKAVEADVSSPATESAPDARTGVKTGRERRRSRRYLCDGSAEVNLMERDTMFRGEIRNLSLHGCFVATRARIHIDKHSGATLRFRLRQRLFKTQAEVVNITPGVGVGFEFRHPTQFIADEIRILVEDYANAPEGASLR